jgi:hypothetical protein
MEEFGISPDQIARFGVSFGLPIVTGVVKILADRRNRMNLIQSKFQNEGDNKLKMLGNLSTFATVCCSAINIGNDMLNGPLSFAKILGAMPSANIGIDLFVNAMRGVRHSRDDIRNYVKDVIEGPKPDPNLTLLKIHVACGLLQFTDFIVREDSQMIYNMGLTAGLALVEIFRQAEYRYLHK